MIIQPRILLRASPSVHFEHPDPSIDESVETNPPPISTDTYTPGRHPIPNTTSKQRAQTNKQYSSRMLRPVSSIPLTSPKTINDVELLPPIVVPLTDGCNDLSNEQVGTAKVDVFTQEIYFDALSTIDNEFDIYNDGLNIVTFGQQTFSTHDPTVTYVAPPQDLIESHGHH